MIRYFPKEVFLGLQEVPDEISLIIPLAGCGHKCKNCHSPHYQNKKNGEVLSWSIYLNLLEQYNNKVSCICFFGGEHSKELASFIWNAKSFFNKKIALYSGYDTIDSIPNNSDFINFLDYIKIGHYNEELGGLESKTTNQKLYKKIDNVFIDITTKFWRKYD
jgi:anaerobic ribonucleoside-triphosphate reductase activating protein